MKKKRGKMSNYAKYDQLYDDLLVARADVTKVLSEIADEVKAGKEFMKQRVAAMRGELDTRLGRQSIAQDEYLQELDRLGELDKAVNVGNNKNNGRAFGYAAASRVAEADTKPDTSGFNRAYGDLLKARSRVESKLVEIDDILTANAEGAVKKAVAMKPDLVGLLDKQADAQKAYNEQLDKIEGKEKPAAQSMARKTFDSLSVARKQRFIGAGGVIRD